MILLAGRVLSLLAPPLCWSCGAGTRAGEPLCGRCRGALRRLQPEPMALAGVEVWAPLAYEGPARALVRALKYRGAASLAGPMAAQIAANAPAGLWEPAAVLVPPTLVPVPLHPARLRSRGYNQAERLAAALARRTGLAVLECLRRTGAATRQVGHGREQRLAGLGAAVELRPEAPIPPHALIVDDVVTTGATLAACAAALRKAGTGSIAAVAFAKTPGR